MYGIWQLTGTFVKKEKNTAGRKISCGMRALAVLVLAVILWNQCMDMTRWFYIDKKKYDAAVKTVDQIAMDLERDFDTSKPVIFTGNPLQHCSGCLCEL